MKSDCWRRLFRGLLQSRKHPDLLFRAVGCQEMFLWELNINQTAVDDWKLHEWAGWAALPSFQSDLSTAAILLLDDLIRAPSNCHSLLHIALKNYYKLVIEDVLSLISFKRLPRINSWMLLCTQQCLEVPTMLIKIISTLISKISTLINKNFHAAKIFPPW